MNAIYQRMLRADWIPAAQQLGGAERGIADSIEKGLIAWRIAESRGAKSNPLDQRYEKGGSPSFDYSRTVFECSIKEGCSDREDRN